MENKTYVISGVPGRPDLEGLELTWKELDEFTQDPNILEVLSGHVQEVEFPEIPQEDLDISTSQADPYKFYTFQDMSDALARGWYEAGNNPYIEMANDEKDPVKKEQLAKQAEIYQKEMEKNSREAVAEYNEKEQSAPAKWLAENLDAFDLATSPVSMGIFGPARIAKMGPLARTLGEAGLQGLLEGAHAEIEGEDIGKGFAAGAASGLLGLYPAIRANKNQALREEILEQAIPLMKSDKELSRKIGGSFWEPSRLNRIKDGPLMTTREEAAFLDRKIPKVGASDPYVGDVIDESGKIVDPGFESDLLKDIEETAVALRGGKDPSKLKKFPTRGEMKVFTPTQARGEPPILNKILDMLPERFDEFGNKLYYWEEVVRALEKWKPSTPAERDLRDNLLTSFLYGPPGDIAEQFAERTISFPRDRAALLIPREKMFEDYPGLGLSALQPLYNAASDPTREAIEDIYEGAEDSIKGIAGLYKFGHRAVTKPEEVFDEEVSRAFKKAME